MPEKTHLHARGHGYQQLTPAACSSSSVKDPVLLPLSLLRDLDIILMVGRLWLWLCTSLGLSAERCTLDTLSLFRVEVSLPRRTSEGVG